MVEGKLRHYVEPGQHVALCGWQPTAEELKRLGSGWMGHPGWPRHDVCDRLCASSAVGTTSPRPIG